MFGFKSIVCVMLFLPLSLASVDMAVWFTLKPSYLFIVHVYVATG